MFTFPRRVLLLFARRHSANARVLLEKERQHQQTRSHKSSCALFQAAQTRGALPKPHILSGQTHK